MTLARPDCAQGVVRKDADEKVAELARELDAARKEFAAKVKQFGEMADELNKRTGDATKGEKKRAAAELADVVRKHNAKYNDMLQQASADRRA